jgi:hypothetical protein
VLASTVAATGREPAKRAPRLCARRARVAGCEWEELPVGPCVEGALGATGGVTVAAGTAGATLVVAGAGTAERAATLDPPLDARREAPAERV